MSYLLSLDEYRETALLEELEQRRTMRAKGLCDYCGRPPATPLCRFPARHLHPEITT